MSRRATPALRCVFIILEVGKRECAPLIQGEDEAVVRSYITSGMTIGEKQRESQRGFKSRCQALATAMAGGEFADFSAQGSSRKSFRGGIAMALGV